MAWDYTNYCIYVKRNAHPSVRRSLLQANSRRYNDKYRNIFLTYYSMPDWMEIFKIGPLIGQRPFEPVAQEYKFAAQTYLKKVSDVLDVVAGVGAGKGLLSGKALLEEIAASKHRTVNVMPRPLLRGQSLANVSEGTMPNTADAYPLGAPIRDTDGSLFGGVGTGKGADVVLFYSPEIWESKDRPAGAGFEPDEVIFHELVHASREFRALQTNYPVDGGFGNEEEYLAVIIADLYLSEKGKPLRAGHDDPPQASQGDKDGQASAKVIEPPEGWNVMKDPDNFYLKNPDNLRMPPRVLMQHFCDTQKSFYLALNKLPNGKPKFNPVKQHFQEPVQARNETAAYEQRELSQ